MKAIEVTATTVFACSSEPIVKGRATLIQNPPVSAAAIQKLKHAACQYHGAELFAASAVSVSKFPKARIIDVAAPVDTLEMPKQKPAKASSEAAPNVALQRLATQNPQLAKSLAGCTLAQQRRVIKNYERNR